MTSLAAADPVLPESARLESAAFCQLQCPLCPTELQTRDVIGKGALRLDDFKRFIDLNPRLRRIELAGNGEAALNKQLPEMLAYAHARGVVARFNQGLNLNRASDALLEAFVRYDTEVIRVAIDGITQRSYETYRVGGRLAQVIDNIKKINAWKAHYQKPHPALVLQFIVFGHNEHEVAGAQMLARMLGMELQLRLNREADVFPVADPAQLRDRVGAADRAEFADDAGQHYCARACLDLWLSPQVNWDGKLLGCSRNKWSSLAPDAFDRPLDELANVEAMAYTRSVVLGQNPPRSDTPCQHCDVYAYMRDSGNFLARPPGAAERAEETAL